MVKEFKAIYYGQRWKIRDSSGGLSTSIHPSIHVVVLQLQLVVLIRYALIFHDENSLPHLMRCIS